METTNENQSKTPLLDKYKKIRCANISHVAFKECCGYGAKKDLYLVNCTKYEAVFLIQHSHHFDGQITEEILFEFDADDYEQHVKQLLIQN